MHPILRDDIYRIAVEAVRNAFRHAHARRIEVEITDVRRRVRRGWTVFASILILLAGCRCAAALNPSLEISRYAHTAWKVRDGFVDGSITAIAQTADGYLWIGTEFDLFRFDGWTDLVFHQRRRGGHRSDATTRQYPRAAGAD